MRDELVLALIVSALSVSSCIDCGVRPAEAQTVPARLAAGGSREAAAVTLARALVSEADGSVADHAPMLSALQYQADRVGASIVSVTRRYVRLYRARVVLPRMRPILAMPGVMPRDRRGQWRDALASAEAWLAGDHAHGCDFQPMHFGDLRGDAVRARDAGWIAVSCPGSRQGYWRVAR